MKRITFWFLTISFTFTFGVAAALVYLRFFSSSSENSESLPAISAPAVKNEPADLPVLAFCELANNPEKYDGQTVRLSAKLHNGLEGSWFSDSNCGVDNAALVWSKNNEVWNAIDKAIENKKGEPWDIEANLIVVGRFKNLVYGEGGLTTPFQFEILKVEKASKVK